MSTNTGLYPSFYLKQYYDLLFPDDQDAQAKPSFALLQAAHAWRQRQQQQQQQQQSRSPDGQVDGRASGDEGDEGDNAEDVEDAGEKMAVSDDGM